MDPRPWLRLAPYIVILALSLGLWGTYNWGNGHKVAREAAETALVALQNAYKAAMQEATNLKKEREHAIAEAIATAREIERQAAATNETRLRAAVAAERRDAGRLRTQLSDALSRTCRATDDPQAAGDATAAILGDVLAEALRVQAELAGAAERHAGEVRALQDGWPR